MNKRAKRVLEQLEEVREQLLGFADDVFHSIDHRNLEHLAKGTEFIKAYNRKLEDFDKLADELSRMIQQYAQVSVEDTPLVPSTDTSRVERIVRELDPATPHYLHEDFTYKRPYGFILRGHAYKDIVTWRHLYDAVCQVLAEINPSRWISVPDNPVFTSAQNKKAFSRDRGDLRSPLPAIRGVYLEAHYSANSIRDNMFKLLKDFSIEERELKIYLRQDRDARDDVA